MIDATRQSPAEQKAFYDENGYILHPELLTQDEVATLRAALDETLEEAKGLTETTSKFSVTRGDDGGHYVRRIFSPIQHHKVFYDMAFHPRIVRGIFHIEARGSLMDVGAIGLGDRLAVARRDRGNGLVDETDVAQRIAFKRCLEVLQETRTIGFWDDLVWITVPYV